MTSLYILHLSALTFLVLESIIILSTLKSQGGTCQGCVTSSSMCVLVSGIMPAIMYTVTVFIVFMPDLVTDNMSLCWMDMTSPLNTVWLAPVSLFALVSFTVLTSSYCGNTTWVDHDMMVDRCDSVARTRHTVLVQILSLAGVCTLGPLSHTISMSQYWISISYQVTRVVLVTSVIMRTLTDKQVTLNIIRKGGESLK